MRLSCSIALLTIAAGSGCSAIADGEYKGEAIASIHGTVTGELRAASGDLNVHATWYWYDATDDPVGYGEDQFVEVTAAFPFGFRLDFFQTPTVLRQIDGARITLSWLYILDGPYPDPDVGGFVPFYAMADRHMVVYLEDDVVPGSLAARFLHGELSAGFHVMEARQRTDCETSRDPAACERGDQDDLYPAPDDLDTIIPMIHVDVTQGVGGILPYPWLTLEELQYPDGSPGREG